MSNLVPEGWSKYLLQDVCYFQEGPGLRRWQYTIKGYPFINIRCIKQGALDLSNVQYISETEALEKYQHFFLNEGDLVLSSSGTLGRMAKVKKSDLPIMLNTSVIRFKSTNEKQLYPTYLPHLLQSSEFVDQITEESQGSAQVNFGPTHLKLVSCCFPPLPEQQKIAAILTSVDEVIEKTQAQIDKLKDLKSGMMQELLTKGVGIKQGDKYEPHTEFKDSPVGRIPKNWQVVSLDNLVKDDKKITYGIVQAGPHHEGGIPYIRVSDMNSRYLTKKGMLLTSPEIAKKFERSAVSTGDIVYALRGMIGHVHIIPNELDGANLTQGTARISPSSNIDTGFLLWAMRSPYVAEQNDLEAKGSTFKEVTLASLRKIQIAVPLNNEQKFISAALTSVESKIFATEDKLEQTKNLKKALMQDLLTGKVRVKVDNDLVS